MTRIVAQREIGKGVQEIVEVDLTVGVVDVLVQPTSEWTYQAPKVMPDGHLMAYRLRPGQQFNIDSASNELAIFDGPGFTPRILPRPNIAAKFMKQNAITWSQHGHATPTLHGTLVHAVNELESWWLFGWPVRRQWVCIETDLKGKPTGARWVDQAEPSWTSGGLTRISTAGTGAIVTPTRTFDKATSPIGSKSFGWFDPHLSPDGSKVVWLDLASVGIGVTSGLIVGNVSTGEVRHLVKPTPSMQTDGMWIDDFTILGSRYISGHWNLITISMNGIEQVIPNTIDCTAVHVQLAV